MDTQVIVVGAGPAGLMLAGELRLGGAEVLVLERLTRPTGQSRASTLHARTMEVLDQRGLLAHFGALESGSAGHFGGLPLDFGLLATRYPGQWKAPQARTEEILQAWAAGLGADIRRGWELRGLTAEAGHIEADVVGPDGPGRLRAPYLVGCDGQDSTVRRLAGFEFAGTDATRELLRADVAGIDIPNRRFQRLGKGLAIAARRADGVTRVMLHEFGRAPSRRSAPPAFDEVVRAWSRVTGEDISGGTPLWVDVFGNTSRQASRYRIGRVLLAGDAAHQQMPVGGQALNLGLQDAANLGWKLAAVARGLAPSELLDSYHDERHPVGARTLTNIAAQAMLLLGGDEAQAPRQAIGELLKFGPVQAHLTGMISGLDVRYPAGEGEHPLVGARMPDVDLHVESGTCGVAALLRPARGVLLDFCVNGDEHAQRRAIAARWADRVHVVRAKPDPAALSGADAVLIRPDGHIAWTSAGPQSLPAALGRWFGEPAGHLINNDIGETV